MPLANAAIKLTLTEILIFITDAIMDYEYHKRDLQMITISMRDYPPIFDHMNSTLVFLGKVKNIIIFINFSNFTNTEILKFTSQYDHFLAPNCVHDPLRQQISIVNAEKRLYELSGTKNECADFFL